MISVPTESQELPYGFERAVELTVVYLAATSPRFWSVIGSRIEPAYVEDPRARDVVVACKAHDAETGRGPASSLLVIQRLAAFVDSGKRDREWLADIVGFFDEVEDTLFPLPSEADLITIAAGIIRRRVEGDLLQAAVARYAARQDIGEQVSALRSAAGIGVTSRDVGTQLDDSVFDSIDRLRHIERLPLGVNELDLILDGGIGRSQLGVVLGGPGDGKSTFLSHIAADAFLAGSVVMLATFELPDTVVLARVIANITGVPISRILAGDWALAQRLMAAASATTSGRLFVREFPAQATSVLDLRQWEDEISQATGDVVDLRITDYADKMRSEGWQSRRSPVGSYEEMRDVYEELRYDAVGGRRWEMTASQTKNGNTKGGGPKGTPADLDMMADSHHKGRVADLVIAMAMQDEGAGMIFRIAKNRHGVSRQAVGPLPVDFSRGRVAPTGRPEH